MAVDSSLEYGKRLIPQILDRQASADPDRIVYSIAACSDDSREFRHISARAFAKAVDKTAWWLHDRVGTQNGVSNGEQDAGQNGTQQETPKIQPLGYIGPRKSRMFRKSSEGNYLSYEDDVRYILLTYGAVKAGCTVSRKLSHTTIGKKC